MSFHLQKYFFKRCRYLVDAPGIYSVDSFRLRQRKLKILYVVGIQKLIPKKNTLNSLTSAIHIYVSQNKIKKVDVFKLKGL